MSQTQSGIFITAPGTEIGKSFICCALLYQIYRAGIAVDAIKPLASGVVQGDPQSDPARLLRAMGKPHHLSAINEICPWRYEPAVAVNLASAKAGRPIMWNELIGFCRKKLTSPSLTLVEGAGGVMSPITDTKLVIDLIKELAIPALMVTGNYLGSISHTLTAMEVLKNRDIPLLSMVVCESEVPAIERVEFERIIRNHHPDRLPLVWVPRNSEKLDAYKFAPSLESLWRNYLSY